jgi:hypothetical protein
VQYRYYKLKEKSVANDVLDRVSAHEIEARVEEGIRNKLITFDEAADFLGIDPHKNPDLVSVINQKQELLSGRDMVVESVTKVVIEHDHIMVRIKVAGLYRLIAEQLRIGTTHSPDDEKEIKIPYITRRAHRGAIMIDAGKNPSVPKDPLDIPSNELRNLVRGIIWRDEHFDGMTLRDIAKRDGFSEGYVGKCIFKSFNVH